MMINFDLNTKCKIDFTNNFKNQLKKIIKQNKDINELLEVIAKLANLENLDPKYRNHNLINDKTYKDCLECHIKPDWLLIYKYVDDKLVLVLFATGSHSQLFKN